ncbi:hypothetical protein MHU86_22580 [Fragilaria crotonensis]|nr:hypothetical protein MHU86_22580 [Fragilaria crotonensis]
MMAISPLPSTTVFLTPRDIDVKCGRGRECFLHPGNSLLRVRVATKLAEYQNQTKVTLKANIVRSVISQFLAEGAKFLKRDRHTKLWYDGGIKAARERVGSAFRDASKPNKVKCMEILKTQMQTKSNVGHTLQSSPTANVGLSHSGSSSGSAEIAASLDGIRTSPLGLKWRSNPTELVESRKCHPSFHQPLDNACADHLLFQPPLWIVDAVNELFRLDQVMGDQVDAHDCECQGSDSTINIEDAKCMWRDIGSDDETFSTTLMEDIDDIDEVLPLTREDMAFLAALDWGKGSS